jgi:hypothetical protein
MLVGLCRRRRRGLAGWAPRGVPAQSRATAGRAGSGFLPMKIATGAMPFATRRLHLGWSRCRATLARNSAVTGCHRPAGRGRDWLARQPLTLGPAPVWILPATGIAAATAGFAYRTAWLGRNGRRPSGHTRLCRGRWRATVAPWAGQWGRHSGWIRLAGRTPVRRRFGRRPRANRRVRLPSSLLGQISGLAGPLLLRLFNTLLLAIFQVGLRAGEFLCLLSLALLLLRSGPFIGPLMFLLAGL